MWIVTADPKSAGDCSSLLVGREKTSLEIHRGVGLELAVLWRHPDRHFTGCDASSMEHCYPCQRRRNDLLADQRVVFRFVFLIPKNIILNLILG